MYLPIVYVKVDSENDRVRLHRMNSGRDVWIDTNKWFGIKTMLDLEVESLHEEVYRILKELFNK